MTLLAPFLDQAARVPDRTAIIEPDGRSIGFGALAALSASRARAFSERGIGSGDRVLVATGIGIELYACLAALWRLGAVPVFPEPSLGLDGLRHAARVTQPIAILAPWPLRWLRWLLSDLRGIARGLPPGEARESGPEPVPGYGPDHPALISFTSGSTGLPKGLLRSHALLSAQHAALAPLLAPRSASEVALIGFPVFVLAHLALGITSILPPPRDHRGGFDADGLAALAERTRATRLLLPPGACEDLLTRSLPPGIREVITGGGPVFPDLLGRLAAALPQARIVSLYGSTEAEPIAHVTMEAIGPADWKAMAEGAGLLAGTPVPAVAILIEDDEILVAGPHVVPGYLDPAHDAASKVTIAGRRWHRTGDAGRIDAAGRLWLLGRHAARIGGIYPFCIEAVARTWPGLRRAALVPAQGRAVLLVEGDPAHLGEWRSRAGSLGPIEVVPLARIPLDARHRSKVDYRALRQIFARTPPRFH